MKYDAHAIQSVLPHRKPFLFVDEVEVGDRALITARYRYQADEFFFAGHFPDYPVVPGVILVETLAQAGGVGLMLSGAALSQGVTFFLAAVNNVKLRRQVRPNDVFAMEVTTLRQSDKLIKQAGKGFVDGELAVEAEWLCIGAAV